MVQKKATKEDIEFFDAIVAPLLSELKASADEWVPGEMPEFEEDPLELTPEQEAEIYRQIRKNRGHNDD